MPGHVAFEPVGPVPEPFEDAEHTHGWLPVDYNPVDYDPDALDAVGAGTKLTGAGYLPPLVVEQIAQAAGVTDWWIGRANREDLTWPVAIFRENAQEVGLLRNAKGTLAPTARAPAAADHPRELVASVLERLPLGKGFEADAGWFLLLGLAAGESGQTLDTGVAQMLTDLGWSTHSSSELSA